MDAYGTQRNPKSLKSFIARQPYKNVHLLHLHLLHLPPYSPPWSAKLKLSALKKELSYSGFQEIPTLQYVKKGLRKFPPYNF